MEDDEEELKKEEQLEALHLDKVEEIEVRVYEELGGGITPVIELLVCNKCDKCRAFAEVIYKSEIGEVIEMDSIRGRSKMREYGLTENDLPALIANGEVEFTGRALTEPEFREWFFYKYGYKLLP